MTRGIVGKICNWARSWNVVPTAPQDHIFDGSNADAEFLGESQSISVNARRSANDRNLFLGKNGTMAIYATPRLKPDLVLSPLIKGILHVVGVSAQEKVSEITTRRIIAFVANKKATWNRAVGQFIRKAVGITVISLPDISNRAVPVSMPVATPCPAVRSIWSRNHSGVEKTDGASLMLGTWATPDNELSLANCAGSYHVHKGIVPAAFWQAIIGLLFLSSAACAQSQNVQQSGQITSSHAACWTTNGVIQDCGTSTGPNSLSTLGITANGGQSLCVDDTKVRTAQYNQLCFGINSSGSANMYITGYGGAVDTFTVWINGVPYPFPSSVPYTASPLRTVSAGTTDIVGSPDQNGTIAWNSNSTSPKTETLFACTSGLNGFNVTIKDEIGTASLYPITITSASTIDGLSTYIMAFNYQAVTLRCDGFTTHWLVT